MKVVTARIDDDNREGFKMIVCTDCADGNPTAEYRKSEARLLCEKCKEPFSKAQSA